MWTALVAVVPLLLLPLLAAQSQAPPPPPPLPVGSHMLNVTDTNPALGRIPRRFVVGSSPGWCARTSSTRPRPLVLGFHGQGHSPETWG